MKNWYNRYKKQTMKTESTLANIYAEKTHKAM